MIRIYLNTGIFAHLWCQIDDCQFFILISHRNPPPLPSNVHLLHSEIAFLHLGLLRLCCKNRMITYMNAGLLRASALRCGEHRQRRLPGKNDLLIRIPKTSILRRCGFPRAPFPTRRTFVLPVCLLGWLKTSTPKWSTYKINLFLFAIIL